MSMRITSKTEIKDITLAKKALAQLKMKYTEQGKTLQITSGKFAHRVVIDTSTGVVNYDSDDRFSDKDFNAFRQAYTEAVFNQNAQRDGVTIDERQVQSNGDIVLMFHTA